MHENLWSGHLYFNHSKPPKDEYFATCSASFISLLIFRLSLVKMNIDSLSSIERYLLRNKYDPFCRCESEQCKHCKARNFKQKQENKKKAKRSEKIKRTLLNI